MALSDRYPCSPKRQLPLRFLTSYFRKGSLPVHSSLSAQVGLASCSFPKGCRVMDKDNVIKAAIIAGMFTVVAAFVGALTTHWFGLTTSPAQAAPTRSATSSSSTVTSPTVTASATPAVHSGGSVHKNGVQLTQCYALSLADPALRPYPVSDCYGGSGDLYIGYPSSTGSVESSAQLVVFDGRAGFSQCESDTAYVPSGSSAEPKSGSLVGTTLCVTTPNRIAAFYVTADTTSANVPAPGLTMDVTVYALK
jgi:hypothetical protein